MSETLKPLFNQVLLKRIEQTVSAGGILLAGDPSGQQAWRAEVLSVGPGAPATHATCQNCDAWELRLTNPIAVKVGQVVYVPAYNGYKVQIGSVEYLLVKEVDILAVVES